MISSRGAICPQTQLKKVFGKGKYLRIVAKFRLNDRLDEVSSLFSVCHLARVERLHNARSCLSAVAHMSKTVGRGRFKG